MSDQSLGRHSQDRESATRGNHRSGPDPLEAHNVGPESNKFEGRNHSALSEIQPTLNKPLATSSHPGDGVDWHQISSSPFFLHERDRPHYEYQPLADTSSIRLIELQPSIGESVLRITIHESPYPPTRKYEALSYTWGTPGETHELYCTDGSKLKITTNLQSALRSLRLSGQARWLWVDAICINQNDNAEKSNQIPLMPGIYRFSEQTVVYLGDADDHSDELLNYADERASAILRNWKLTTDDESNEVNEETICQVILTRARPNQAQPTTKAAAMVQEFIMLLARPWFSRVWTLQEFAVPEKIIFRCGTAACKWYSPYLLYCEFLTLFQDLRRFVGLDDSYAEDFKVGLASFRGMMELRAKCINLEPLDFQELVFTSSIRNASLGHDKLYALFGLWQHSMRSTTHLQPNYDLELHSLYRIYAKAFVENGTQEMRPELSPALNLLYDAPTYREKLDGLPSWVPHWSTRPLGLPLGRLTKQVSHCKTSPYYDASGWFGWAIEPDFKSIPLVPIHPDPRILPERYPKVTDTVLKIRGVISDDIASIIRILPIESIRIDLPPLFEGMRTLETSGAKNPYPTNEDMTTVAWKTLVGNTDGNRSPPAEWRESYLVAPAVLQRFPASYAFTINHQNEGGKLWDAAWGDEKQFMDAWQRSPDPEENLRYIRASHPDPETYISRLSDLQIYQRHVGFFTAIKTIATGRTLFLTKKGLIGWCPDSAQPGDKICIFSQATVPFILRPYDEGSYTFIGDSYIHGAMNGEYLLHDDIPIEVSMPRGKNGEEEVFSHIYATPISIR